MSVDYLHFDTLDASYAATPFNCTFQLMNPLKKVKTISLKSAEIPIGWYNVRTPQQFSMVISNNTQFISSIHAGSTPGSFLYNILNSTDYTYISPLINNAIQQTIVQHPGAQFGLPIRSPPIELSTIPAVADPTKTYLACITFIIPAGTYSANSLIYTINQGIINYVKSNPTMPIGSIIPQLSSADGDFNDNINITFDDTYGVIVGFSNLMTNILGYKPFQYTIFNGSLIATSTYQLFSDTYISLYFTNLPHNNTNFNNKFTSFKLPISAGLQTILYSGDNNQFGQYIQITDPNFVVSTLSLVVYDRYGIELTSQHGTIYHWSFTLGFEYYN